MRQVTCCRTQQQSASVTKKSETIAYFATPVLNPRLIDFCRQTKRNWRNYLKRPNKRSGSLGHDQETCGVQPELTVFIHPDPLNVQTCKCMQIMSERVNTDDVVAWNLNDVQSWHVLAREGSLLQAEAKEIERADAVKAAQAVSLGVNIARCCTRFVWIFGNIFVHDREFQAFLSQEEKENLEHVSRRQTNITWCRVKCISVFPMPVSYHARPYM